MNKKIGMNVFLHSILVAKEMDNFTITEAKDALVREHVEFADEKEARKFIYRQLSRNIEKGLIKRMDSPDGNVRKVIYSKTDKFFSSSIIPTKYGSKLQTEIPPATFKVVAYKTELKKKLVAYEINLNATLEEEKEYKRLFLRFPELQETLQQHQSEAKDKSIKLLGKVHALQNLLGYAVTRYQSC